MALQLDLPRPAPELRPQLSLLERLLTPLLQDRRVMAGWLFGSLARGTADAYSDVDLELVAEPSALHEWLRQPLSLLGAGGDPHYHWGGGDATAFIRYGALYPGSLVLDVGVYAQGQPVPRRRDEIRPVLDRGGLRAGHIRLVGGARQQPEAAAADLEQRLSLFFVWATTALRFHRRGNAVWAAGFLGDLRAVLAQVLWLLENPGRDLAFPIACAWGAARTDLSEEARERLSACLVPADHTDLPAQVEICLAQMASVGREAAQLCGCRYPEALEAEVRSYLHAAP